MSLNQDQPEGLESVLVRTDFGQRIYPKDKRVYTHPGQDHPLACQKVGYSIFLTFGMIEDSYEWKTAGELEEGESVLLALERFNYPNYFDSWYPKTPPDQRREILDIDFIDSYVTRIIEDERHLKAKEQLFVDVEGRTVPRLEYEILEAAAKKGLISQEVQERRLSGDNKDPSDIIPFITYLFKEYNELYKGEPKPSHRKNVTPRRTRATFNSYLQGGHVAPTDLRVLYGLAEVLDHDPFREMYEDGREGDERAGPPDVNMFWDAKKFYDSERKRRIAYGRLFCQEIVEVKPLEA